MTVYSQCGLRVRSEIELPLPPIESDAWDVDVRWGADIDDSDHPPPGEVIASYGSGEDSWYTATDAGSEFRLRFRDCGEFVISADLTNVEVRRAPTERAPWLPILMAGTAGAFLLTLRGHTVLHSSAVAIDGHALAFIGQSGRGKSTLATVMCLDGAQVVTDDVLTVHPGDPVTCRGGATELRLRDSAAPLAEDQPEGVKRDTEDDRLALTLDAAPLEPLPLSAIVVPAPSRSATTVEFRRLDPSTALFWILAFPRIYGWCRPDILSHDFSTISQLVNSVPVYDVTVPWGPPFKPEVARELRALATGGVAPRPSR
jgi:hypothetical protein